MSSLLRKTESVKLIPGDVYGIYQSAGCKVDVEKGIYTSAEGRTKYLPFQADTKAIISLYLLLRDLGLLEALQRE